MNKRSLGLLVVFGLVGLFVLGCAGLSQEVKKEEMSFVVTTPVLELNNNAKVVMYGTGFAPKQEIQFLLLDASGVPSVITTDDLKPEPVPNTEGAWATVWTCAPYLPMLKAGTVMIAVTDNEYKTLTQIPVAFVAPPKKPEPKKDAPKKQ
jgi:hypothetical protein